MRVYNKVFAAFCFMLGCTSGFAQGVSGPQLYNMGFDEWTKVRKQWCLYGEGATEAEKAVWGTANKGLSLLGINGTTPEEEFVDDPGPGKKAARLQSRKVVWAFAAGNIYNGQWVRIINFSGAEITWGTPFKARPKSLSGYYCYKPKPIKHTKPQADLSAGDMDEGRIEVILTDWDKPFHVITNDDKFVDKEGDSGIIGYGTIVLRKANNGYVHFDLPIQYRNSRTPKYVVVVCAASRCGDYFTGGDGTVLYVDEFQFNY